jgi:hypothetical protein
MSSKCAGYGQMLKTVYSRAGGKVADPQEGGKLRKTKPKSILRRPPMLRSQTVLSTTYHKCEAPKATSYGRNEDGNLFSGIEKNRQFVLKKRMACRSCAHLPIQEVIHA